MDILLLLLLIGNFVMGGIILAALAAQTQAITDLQARAAGVVSQTEADAIKSSIETNTAAINAVLV